MTKVTISLENSVYTVYVDGNASFSSATSAKALEYANDTTGLSYTDINDYQDTTTAGVDKTQKEINDLQAEDTLSKEYIALITQSGTDAPTVQVIKNELSAAVVWAYSNVGIYTGTLVGAFTASKTAVVCTPLLNASAAGVRTSADVVTLSTTDSANAAANGVLTASYLQIIVGA